ncbi:unnamed protein product [Psylliodes chrysocephalus]|uniref:Uncharacterized protein n=1 Tax=Psylliodes chrysocephalus TaxID=3402493 RepID=A0A9P0CXJ2_9CUCU|nr:unnamed protein product [Psylliodes chrysocephala]
MAANSERVRPKLSKKSKIKVENKPFYDSDEEIGWGRKLTLKEVKARLNKPQFPVPQLVLDPHARYSTPSFKQTNFVSSESHIENEMEQINKDDSIPAISEYLTASEEGNSVCATNYLSVVEPNVEKSSVYLSTIDIEESDNNLVDTRLNFVKKALNTTVDDIENEYHTFETTVSSSIESTDSSISISKNDLVILISSDEDELESQDFSFEMKREQLSCVTEEGEDKSNSFSSQKDFTTGNDAYSTKNCRTDEGTAWGKSSFYARNSKPAIDELDISSASALNTTLDRMNAILGENLSLNENANSEDEEEVNKNSLTVPQTCNLISGSFLHLPTSLKFNTADKHCSPERPYNTPSKTTKPIKLTPKNTPISKSNIPIFKKSPDFRMPDLPNKPKTLNRSKVNYKDIVSPVRMYIKYSPKPVLQQTVHAKDKPYSKFNHSPRVLEAGNQMDSLAIPNVVYKPSKKQIFALDETTNFPFSLDKMIKKSSVVKHERHPLRPNCYQDETLDPEAELTKSFLSDCSNLSGIENISILHKKTALRK